MLDVEHDVVGEAKKAKNLKLTVWVDPRVLTDPTGLGLIQNSPRLVRLELGFIRVCTKHVWTNPNMLDQSNLAQSNHAGLVQRQEITF